MNEVRTCHGQTIKVGSQVAYVRPLVVDVKNTASKGKCVLISATQLLVSRVVKINERYGAWAEADAVIDLVLESGHTVDCEEVAVTDGNFSYA